VVEAKPDDAGTGKARVSETFLNSLSLKEGDVIEIKGKRLTAAKVWKTLSEDQDDDVIRIDGLIRKNADIVLNEYVTIRRADMKDAKSIALASIEANIMHDGRFQKLVKLRLLGAPLVKDDSILLDFMGATKPFKVFLTEPTGIVNVCESTKLQVIYQQYSDARDILNEGLTFLRFRYLKDVEKKLGADYTRFSVPKLIEHEHEGEVLKEAKKRVNNTKEPITVFVDE
jgi:transitional endoplasmic reticulum ATPase